MHTYYLLINTRKYSHAFLLIKEPKHIIKKAEAFYKMELEQIQKDSDALKQTLEEQNTKISALKTRNKVICDEATSYKLKTMDLLEKSENDDKYIQVLNVRSL